MSLTIIFEDSNLLILDKPSGLVVHPFDYSTEETLVDMLQGSHPEIFTITNPVTLQDGRTMNLGGIAHKLDRDTSGVLVVAKNRETFDEIKQQFKNQAVQKIYLTLVEGVIEKDTFTIDGPLGRNKKDYKQMVNPSNPRGELRSAVTDVHVLKRTNTTTLVELSPKTGRTHQLRAHMTHIGHPIIGDKAYGSTTDTPRIMLHAQKITFTLFEKDYTFESDVPQTFLE